MIYPQISLEMLHSPSSNRQHLPSSHGTERDRYCLCDGMVTLIFPQVLVRAARAAQGVDMPGVGDGREQAVGGGGGPDDGRRLRGRPVVGRWRRYWSSHPVVGSWHRADRSCANTEIKRLCMELMERGIRDKNKMEEFTS